LYLNFFLQTIASNFHYCFFFSTQPDAVSGNRLDMAVDLKAHSPVGPTLKFGRDDRVDRKLIIGLDFGTTYTGQCSQSL